MGDHIIDGEFQSDKYPTCPRGKVPLSVKDKTAQDLLWEYAQRRRAVDAEFSVDLETALRVAGYEPPGVEQGDGWVSVGERLPEERREGNRDCSVDVLVVRNGRVAPAFYDHGFKMWHDHSGLGGLRGVTHWRPLPEPPGGENVP